MPSLNPPPGLTLDIPMASPSPRWWSGMNVRFRLGMLETVGLYGALLDVAGAQVSVGSTGVNRTVFTTPSTSTGQILIASADKVTNVEYDPNSTPATGTRWLANDITPAGLLPTSDVVTVPSAGRISIPPVWWFADQDDVVVGSRANVNGDPAYAWARGTASPMTPIANSPTGAVGGGIVNRIMVLLGCTSFTDPDPSRAMTIRWSDRFNFEDWTPSDINLSGELQLEGGSRIVGGGVTGFGVIAWTDKRMALLTETGNINSVFSRRYVDGSRGMLANKTWCEADGQVWWYDEARVLNVFDGGRPRQVQNPLKYGTIDRVSDAQMARAYMVPNPEFGEILLWYPDGDGTEPDVALVYNYLFDAWSAFSFPPSRTGWASRVGVIPNIAVDEDGNVWRHDLDVSLGPPWIEQASPNVVPASEVTAYDFNVRTNLITTQEPTFVTHHMTRIQVDHLPSPAAGLAQKDTFSLTLKSFLETTLDSTSIEDTQEYTAGQSAADFRGGGKALQLLLSATQVKTVFRYAGFASRIDEDGER